jgi:serine/threonine protein kinase
MLAYHFFEQIPLQFKQAVEIIVDLHSNGLVHGSVMEQSFAVGPSGNLCLARFQNMRPEDPNVPFHPIGNLSVGATAFMAPELLRSLRDNESVSLSKATDIYGLGCLGYQV